MYIILTITKTQKIGLSGIAPAWQTQDPESDSWYRKKRKEKKKTQKTTSAGQDVEKSKAFFIAGSIIKSYSCPSDYEKELLYDLATFLQVYTQNNQKLGFKQISVQLYL